MASSYSDTAIKIIHALGRPREYDGAQAQSLGVVSDAPEFISLLIHAFMTARGFRVVSVGGDDAVDQSKEKTLSINEPELLTFFPLPATWNVQRGCYRFTYKHNQSAMAFSVVCINMNDTKVVVLSNSVSESPSKPCLKFEVNLTTHLSAAASQEFPLHLGNVALHSLFSMVPKLRELQSDFSNNVCEGLVPGLVTPMDDNRTPQRPPVEPYRRIPPGGGFQPVNPLGIGDRDVDPLGPLRPPHPGGGMIVGPEHPMFHQPPLAPDSDFPGPERFPPGAVPPGARFDPVTPFDPMNPLRIPGRGGGQGGRGGGSGQPFSGDPDFDEATPPGYGNMFM